MLPPLLRNLPPPLATGAPPWQDGTGSQLSHPTRQVAPIFIPTPYPPAPPPRFTKVDNILVLVQHMTHAPVVGPKLTGQARKNKERITRIQIDSIKGSLQQFEVQTSRFPTTQEGLQALVVRPSGMSEEEWPGQVMEKLPKDGFGRPFDYKQPSEHGLDYDIVSAGADGKMGTEDDIANYESGTPEAKNL